MAECSELGFAISDIALNFGSRGDVKNIGDIVRKMNGSGLKVTRENVVEALVAASKSTFKLSDLVKKLSKIKGEARTDIRLRKQIDELEGHLSEGTRPGTKKRIDISPKEIKNLRKVRDSLKSKIFKIDAREREFNRINSRIKVLESNLKRGTLPPIIKGTPREVDAGIAKLRERRDALQKQITERRLDERQKVEIKERISEFEKHIKEGTLPTREISSKKVPAELQNLRNKRDLLRKELGQSEPAQKQRLLESIDLLEQRLREGVSLPTKTPEVRLSKELERLTFERDLLRTDINQRIKLLKPRSLFSRTVGDTFDFARTIMTSGEFSGVLRQGGFIGLGHPVRASKSLVPMFKSVVSDFQAAKVMKKILDRDNAPLYARFKLSLTDVDGVAKLSGREEVYKSNILEQLQRTKVGKILTFPIKASERAYTTFLNKLRADSFDAMSKTLAKNGEPTNEEYKVIADFVNSATGRGDLGKLEVASEALSRIFFAPRYLKSRIDLITLKPFRGGTKATKKLIAMEYARYLAGLSTVYGILKYSTDATVETSPTSSDFGKIKIGNVRLDPLSGLSQTAVIAARILSGETKSSITGRTSPIRGKVKFGRKDTFDVSMDFLRSKLAPGPSTFFDVVTGKNVIGQPTTPESVAKNLTIPMSFGDIHDAMEELGVEKALIPSIANIFGIGLQTYGPTTKRARRERAKKEALK